MQNHKNTSRTPRRSSSNLLKNTVKTILLVAICLGGLPAKAQVGTAVRELPYDFHPGDLVEVRLQVTPPLGTTNWSIRELYTNRWELVSATNASSIDEFNGELVFGPFTNDSARTLSYEILSNPGLTNSVTFAGTVTNNGVASLVAGTTFFPARNEWLFVGPQSLWSLTGVSGTAYGAGRWVASSSGWVTTLEPGGRLTYPRALGALGDSRLAYLGGLFFQFGTYNNAPRMRVSDDGISWKQAINESGYPNPFVNGGTVNAMCYTNGIWVAVGSQWFSGENPEGAVFMSTNGYGWKRAFRGGSPWMPVQGVAFANEKFLAVGQYGVLLSSTNGSDWTMTRPIRVLGDPDLGTNTSVWMNRHLQGICHGPAGWIIPTSVSGTVLRSTDGVDWTAISASGGPDLSISDYSTTFFADGKYWFSMPGYPYTTVDGTSWTKLPSLASIQPVNALNRAPDGVSPQYLAAGTDYASLVASTNGTDWSIAVLGAAVPGNSGTQWPFHRTVVAVSNEWVISAQGASGVGANARPSDRSGVVGGGIWMPGANPDLFIRNAGGQWRRGVPQFIPDALLTTNGVLACRVETSALQQLKAGFVAGTNFGLDQPYALPVLIREVAGQVYKGIPIVVNNYAWANASFTPSPGGFDLFIESYYNTRIIWGHFTSTNGSNWIRRAEGLNHATNFPAIRGLAWGAGRFVAVSEGSSPGPATPITSTDRIYTSTNGEDYVAIPTTNISPLLNNEGLTGVAYASGRFVAIGNSGRILSSTNGLDWVTVRNSDSRRWNRVRYLDGIWAAVGNAGWVAFSPDGQNWTSKTAGAESDLTDIAHQNGSYMVVGSHAMVLLSLPVTPPTILAGTLTKLPGMGLQFDVSGQAGKFLDIQTSSNLVHWTSLVLRTNTTGTVTITDPEPNQERRFYRVVQQP